MLSAKGNRMRLKTELPDLTEKQFQAQVRELAELFGWKVACHWKSLHSPKGWPDLQVLKGTRLLVIECKTEKGQPSPEQCEWLELLEQVPGVEAYLLRPSDLDEVTRILR